MTTSHIDRLLDEYRCLLSAGTHVERIDEIEALLDAAYLPAHRMPSAAVRSTEQRLQQQRQHQTFTIAWSGPWAQSDAIVRTSASGLYLLYGKCRYERRTRMQYCGITQQYFSDRFSRQYRLYEITRGLEIWIGHIAGVHIPLCAAAARRAFDHSCAVAAAECPGQSAGAVADDGRIPLV